MRNELHMLIYALPLKALKLFFSFAQLLSDFWYFELLLAGLCSFIIAGYLSSGKHAAFRDDTRIRVLLGTGLVFVFGVVFYSFIYLRFLRMKTVFVLLLCLIPVVARFFRKVKTLTFDAQLRMIMVLVTAGLLLLILDNLAWRDLVEKRFLLVLIPFVFYLVYISVPAAVVRVLSVVLIVSGGFYLFSSGISDEYGTPGTFPNKQVFFKDVHSFSTYYFENQHDAGRSVRILDKSEFKKFCKLCDTGSLVAVGDQVNERDEFSVVGRENLNYTLFVPGEFILVRQNHNLRLLDRFMLKHFSPVYFASYAAYDFKRKP